MSDYFYAQSIELLRDIKLTQGNTALNATLRRHSKFRDSLVQYQRQKLKKIEEHIDSHEL